MHESEGVVYFDPLAPLVRVKSLWSNPCSGHFNDRGTGFRITTFSR